MSADLFVPADWRNPGQRDAWYAQLSGGRLTCVELIITGKGPSIRYSNATATRRIVWLFPTFLAAHPALARILRVPCALHPHHIAHRRLVPGRQTGEPGG